MEGSAESSRWGGLIEVSPRQLTQVFVLGLVIGALAWLITEYGAKILFEPMLCGGAQSCDAAGAASTAASLMAAIAGIVGLIQIGIYRPIIVVIASAICLWDVGVWVSGLFWPEALLWTALLYGICYLTFTWLVRPRRPIIFLSLIILLILLVRLLPVLSGA